MMNIGYQLQPGETGIPDNWAERDLDQVIGDEIEYWLSGLTMHSHASEIARDIVISSRKRL